MTSKSFWGFVLILVFTVALAYFTHPQEIGRWWAEVQVARIAQLESRLARQIDQLSAKQGSSLNLSSLVAGKEKLSKSRQRWEARAKLVEVRGQLQKMYIEREKIYWNFYYMGKDQAMIAQSEAESLRVGMSRLLADSLVIRQIIERKE